MPDGYFVTPVDAEQVEMLPRLYRRTMATTDEVMICEFFIERGVEVPVHQHMNDQVAYIIRGQLEVTIGDQVRIMNPGESYAVPGGILHKERAIVDTLVVDAFSPPRQDYRTEAR